MLSIDDRIKLEEIPVIFARGVDTMASNTTNDEALLHLSKVFSIDCSFEFLNPDGSVFNRSSGLKEFLDFGFEFMKEKQYTATLHHASNIYTETAGANLVHVHSSVVAYHIKSDQSQDIALARYIDVAHRDGSQWTIRIRKCQQLAFNTVRFTK